MKSYEDLGESEALFHKGGGPSYSQPEKKDRRRINDRWIEIGESGEARYKARKGPHYNATILDLGPVYEFSERGFDLGPKDELHYQDRNGR